MLLATSEITRSVDRAFLLIGGVSILLLAGITIAIIVLVVYFGRDRATTTKQIHGHTVLEITWIVVPVLIVTWMFYVGYEGFALMRSVPDDAMVVEVTGRQWTWSFRYPEEKIDATEMVVPVGVPVKVELTAPEGDVVHSFYIPDFRVKEDAVPGQNTYLWFESDREGSFHIFCAEFCGKDHSKMISTLRVVSQEEYDRWVKDIRSKKYQPLEFEGVENPESEMFAKLDIDASALYGTFCASCHGAAGDGSGLPGVARNFTSADNWKRSPKVTDIYRTLSEGIPDTQMRPYPNLSPWERVALAHYVRAFLKTDPPKDTRADYDALVQEYELDKVQAPTESIPIDRAMEILVEEAGDEKSKPVNSEKQP